jgi:RNA polymerase sigma factor (sigma-70 family)
MAGENISDEELAVKAIAGDPAAQSLCYRRYGPRIFGYCSRFVGRLQEAEDATNEVFTKFYRSRTYDPSKGTLDGYIKSIAKNICIDHLNRARKLPRYVAEFISEPVASAASEEPDPEITKRAREFLKECAEGRGQDILELLKKGLSYEEIAQSLNLEYSTVSAQICRIKKCARNKMESMQHSSGYASTEE